VNRLSTFVSGGGDEEDEEGSLFKIEPERSRKDPRGLAKLLQNHNSNQHTPETCAKKNPRAPPSSKSAADLTRPDSRTESRFQNWNPRVLLEIPSSATLPRPKSTSSKLELLGSPGMSTRVLSDARSGDASAVPSLLRPFRDEMWPDAFSCLIESFDFSSRRVSARSSGSILPRRWRLLAARGFIGSSATTNTEHTRWQRSQTDDGGLLQE